MWLLLAPVCGSQPQPKAHEWLTEDLMVEELGADIWRHVSYRELETFGRSAANGLVVVSGGTAALVDTPWTDAQTVDLLTWVSNSIGARVESVIVTHSHPDCLGGLAAAHERGASSYSSETTAAFAHRDGKEVPQHTFAESLTVRIGARELQLRFAGPGHTADNIIVWIPEDRLLFGGCLVRSGSSKHLGYSEEADLANWPKTIEALLVRFPDLQLVVPGHGAPGGRELLDRTLELLRHDLARRAR